MEDFTIHVEENRPVKISCGHVGPFEIEGEIKEIYDQFSTVNADIGKYKAIIKALELKQCDLISQLGYVLVEKDHNLKAKGGL